MVYILGTPLRHGYTWVQVLMKKVTLKSVIHHLNREVGINETVLLVIFSKFVSFDGKTFYKKFRELLEFFVRLL